MDAVPIYNVNPAASSGFNGWEAMALLNNNRNSNGFGDGFGGWWAWILILILFGGWGGGWGGFGGNRCGCNSSGNGALGIDLAIRDAANIAELRAGANYNGQANATQINLVGQLKDLVAGGFANVSNAITQNGYQTQLGQRDLQAALAQCCCQTQQNIAGVNYSIATTGAAINNNITQQTAQLNYNSAMQTCELKQAIAAEGQATRALIQAQYTADIERKLAEANQQLFVLNKFGQYAGGNCNCNNSCGCGSSC